MRAADYPSESIRVFTVSGLGHSLDLPSQGRSPVQPDGAGVGPQVLTGQMLGERILDVSARRSGVLWREPVAPQACRVCRRREAVVVAGMHPRALQGQWNVQVYFLLNPLQ